MNTEEINDIARRLTQQWTTLVKARVATRLDVQSKSFLNHLEANGRIVFQCEDKDLLDKAMESIPLQRLYEEAEEKSEGSEEGIQDQVIQQLLHWFKREFFSWVNNAPCQYCHSEKTRSNGNKEPSSEDLKYGAHVVETYLCSLCHAITRFPRYNSPGKLLETRRGRCGEWANCFTLCCRAVGSEARIVYDTTDHVWTEVYSELEQRWIHCDPCEDAWDRPLMYSLGWNKKLSYCTAFSIDEAVDVTKRYTRHWPQTLERRNKVTEAQLAMFLSELTDKRQHDLDQNRRNILEQRKLKELLELEECGKKKTIKDDEWMGRQSGSLVWRTSRGETTEKTTENVMKPLHLEGNQLYVAAPNPENDFTILGGASMQYDRRSVVQNHPIIRLTRAVPDQRGGAYLKQHVQLDAHVKGLEIEFAFCITNSNDQPAMGGADGFAFVIQSQGETSLGEGGCELGFGGLKHCLAVEFDTYQSSDRCADPSGNHISIQARLPPFSNSAHHDYSLGHTSRIPSLQCGKWMKSKIVLLTNGTIDIGLAEIEDTQYIRILEIKNQNFCNYVSDQAWIGFTASTGGLSQNHDVQLLSVIQYKT